MVTYIIPFIIIYIITTHFPFFCYYFCKNNILLGMSTEVSLLPLLLTKGCRIFFDKDFRNFVIVSPFPNGSISKYGSLYKVR